MKNSLIAVLCFLIFIGSSGAEVRAEDEQLYKWSVEMRSGAYWPDSDEWEQVYGREARILSEILFRYKILPRLEVGGGVGFLLANGEGRTLGGQTSDEDFTIILAPLQAEGVYRFDLFPQQLLVPYVKAGVDLWFYRETDDDSRDWAGAKGGFHAGGGVQLLLDRLDPEGAEGFMHNTGILNSYLVLDVRYANVDAFGSGDLDLSGWIIQGGLCFQF